MIICFKLEINAYALEIKTNRLKINAPYHVFIQVNA